MAFFQNSVLNKDLQGLDAEILKMEWMEVFEAKKAEAQELKAEINRVDAEIDRMVNDLYGLT